MASVIIAPEALEQLNGLPAEIVARVEKLFARLEAWPEVSGKKALRGPLAGHWRLRTGDYRVQFRVQGETVTVEKIGHRDKFYDQ